MKKVLQTLVLLVVFAAVAAGLIHAYLKMREERGKEGEADAPVVAASHVSSGDDGVTIKLDDDAQERLGLKMAKLAKTSVSDEVTASARVLDGGDLAQMLTDLQAAESALEASRADFKRKEKLAVDGQNVSTSAVEVAQAAMKHDEFARDSAQTKIVATWGSTLASRPDLATLAAALLKREETLVRIDLSVTDQLDDVPEVASLERLNGFKASARLLGPAPSTDNPLSAKSLLYQVTGNADSLVPGSVLTAKLARKGSGHEGWLVPRSAIVRNAGRGWVYVQEDDDGFRRKPIELEHPQAEGWVIFEEIEKPIVIHGAQSLLSEEMKGSMEMD